MTTTLKGSLGRRARKNFRVILNFQIFSGIFGPGLKKNKNVIMSETLFTKIIDREIPADIVYEDELCLAFKDINPQAPLHILMIPKKNIVKISDTTELEQDLLGHLLLKAGEIANAQGYGEAFRLVINNGENAGQTVFHLHIHILAGRSFSWPPG